MPSTRALRRLESWPAPPPRPCPQAAVKEEESRWLQSSSSTSSSSSSASAPAKPAASAAVVRGGSGGRVYPLRDFPGWEAAALGGAFRDNVRWLLKQWGPAAGAASGSASASVWGALLSDERNGAIVPIVAVEELAAASPAPLCDLCRCAGWSHHWVSKRKYHFIIPTETAWDQPLRAAMLLGRSDHLLHGLIHSNGFGHLVTLRGRDGGSTFLSGCEIMDIWDRLCSALRVRAVSVVDLTRKRSVDLRLLLGVAHGETWFTRWGYYLAKGCFSVSTSTYAAALEALAAMPVDYLRSRHVRRVVTIYRRLSNKPLATVREFLRCLLDWKHREPPLSPPPAMTCPRMPFLLPKSCVVKRLRQPCQRFEDVVDLLHCRWSKKRLLNAAEVVVDKLLEHADGTKMTRQAVRDASRGAIGDTGLLDFVIKSLSDTIVGNHIVRRVPDPKKRVLHFSLEEYAEPEPEPMEVETERAVPVVRWPSTAEVERDLRAVYRAMVEAHSEAAQAVLDCKHWVKWWGLGDESDDQLRFLVEWRPRPWEATELTRLMPPGDIVVVPLHASIGELLVEAEYALRDTYCFFEEFQAEALDGISGEKWDPVMLGGAESGDTIGVHGHGADMETRLRYQGGADAWEVQCVCGAQDDDGERMVACDTCDVWHHTRCVGIADGEPVPPLFLCMICGGALMAAGPMLDEALTVPEVK
ncbi:PHD finger protein MALE MEIOCYTE DEATH 1-like [Phragmites australis]|uniref:PHD finger protein MALE MEIOCYTE DEATH 1-like n=1 Tax=Phragmites australis TaxID=29695 RepID=UPI002D777073|nr:PHD finger protein MALE MEIOCYTE DEATH 1-like [Phragmites australis]